MRGDKGPEGALFRSLVDKQGHFKGPYDENRSHEINKQGVYCFAPSGRLLASVYSNEPAEVEATLKKALAQWQTMPPAERLGRSQLDPRAAAERPEKDLPFNNGLILRETVRDLPRRPPQDEFYAGSWNRDFVWFKGEEAQQFLPHALVPGASTRLPDDIVRRLSRAHFIDVVRSLDTPYEDCDVKQASLVSTVMRASNNQVKLRLTGSAVNSKVGEWAINGAEDHANPTPQKRGVSVNMLGYATYDLAMQRFTDFQLIALGNRWGSTQWNGRTDDLAGGPIGYLFTLSTDNSPSERMAPYALTWGMYW